MTGERDVSRVCLFACEGEKTRRERDVRKWCRWERVDSSMDPRVGRIGGKRKRLPLPERWSVRVLVFSVGFGIVDESTGETATSISVIYIQNYTETDTQTDTLVHAHTYTDTKTRAIHRHTYTIINVWDVEICLNKYLKHLKRKLWYFDSDSSV